jgi:hypothetical protein
MLRKRPDWSRPLPRRLVIPGVMTLKTLADARELVRRVPKERRALSTWQHVITSLDDAARGGDVASAAIALRLVLQLENVPCRPR